MAAVGEDKRWKGDNSVPKVCNELNVCLSHAVLCFLRNSASSFHWLSSSIFTVRSFVRSSRIRDTSSHLHYRMFQTIQIIYFLWGYDPGNMSVSFSLYSLLSWADNYSMTHSTFPPHDFDTMHCWVKPSLLLSSLKYASILVSDSAFHASLIIFVW